MGPIGRTVWPALILLLLTSCGGGREDALSSSVSKLTGAAAPCASQVVVRLDWDQDGHTDVLTLDTSTNPLVVTDALRGTADGGGVDATAAWRGRSVGPVLNDTLQLYLARSMSVASQTDLDVVLYGKHITVTVIE